MQYTAAVHKKFENILISNAKATWKMQVLTFLLRHDMVKNLNETMDVANDVIMIVYYRLTTVFLKCLYGYL